MNEGIWCDSTVLYQRTIKKKRNKRMRRQVLVSWSRKYSRIRRKMRTRHKKCAFAFTSRLDVWHLFVYSMCGDRRITQESGSFVFAYRHVLVRPPTRLCTVCWASTGLCAGHRQSAERQLHKKWILTKTRILNCSALEWAQPNTTKWNPCLDLAVGICLHVGQNVHAK